MDIKRREDNIKCLQFLTDILLENDLRIEQLLYILDSQKDFFNEEPSKTLERWSKVIKK